MEIVINFKTYRYGKEVLKLAKAVEKVNKKIIVGVQPTDVQLVAKDTKLKVYCQHVDYIDAGRGTGFVTAESVKALGAEGVFLNHSEHPLDFKVLKKTIGKCKKLNLKVIVFGSGLKELKRIEKLKPNLLVYEPPSLVAGKVSVSNSKPKVIEKICKKIKMPVLVGAGIKTKKDVEIAKELGAEGVAFSSVITKAKNPEKVLKNLGF